MPIHDSLWSFCKPHYPSWDFLWSFWWHPLPIGRLHNIWMFPNHSLYSFDQKCLIPNSCLSILPVTSDNKFNPVQKKISCDEKFLALIRNFFMWQIISVGENILIWQYYYSYHKKVPRLSRNLFLQHQRLFYYLFLLSKVLENDFAHNDCCQNPSST